MAGNSTINHQNVVLTQWEKGVLNVVWQTVDMLVVEDVVDCVVAIAYD